MVLILVDMLSATNNQATHTELKVNCLLKIKNDHTLFGIDD